MSKELTKYGIFYVNVNTNEKVAFNHCQPIHFNKEQANQFIKDMNYNRWLCNSTPYPKHWSMKSLPLTSI